MLKAKAGDAVANAPKLRSLTASRRDAPKPRSRTVSRREEESAAIRTDGIDGIVDGRMSGFAAKPTAESRQTSMAARGASEKAGPSVRDRGALGSFLHGALIGQLQEKSSQGARCAGLQKYYEIAKLLV